VPACPYAATGAKVAGIIDKARTALPKRNLFMLSLLGKNICTIRRLPQPKVYKDKRPQNHFTWVD
jgi:hypothetical protein